MTGFEGGAAYLVERLGRPALGVLAGSGFQGFASALGAGDAAAFDTIPGFPSRRAPGHGGGVAAADVDGARVWIVLERLHTYERLDALEAAHPIGLLAAAGAGAVLLTCAAGGLRDDDRPGDFAVVTDHLNLLGDDPIRRIPPDRRKPAFVDLQHAYDPALSTRWHAAARRHGIELRDGILAALPGPCYETPAEVRMLRGMGADLASMSVVPETILAAYLGLRVAAIACVSNRGAGLDGAGVIAHDDVVDVVVHAVRRGASFLRDGLSTMLF